LRDETSSPSKKDRLVAILRKFKTEDICLTKEIDYTDKEGTAKKLTIEQSLAISYGELVGSKFLHDFLESTDATGKQVFFDDTFEMPNYDKDTQFDFDEIEDALELALLYEEAYGNKHIRDYCSSLITRYKSIKERQDFNFMKEKSLKDKNTYLNELLGLDAKKKVSQIIILNIDSIEDELVELVSSVLTRMIFDKLKVSKNRNIFPVNLILEEAHRYISNDSQKNLIKSSLIFERVAKEGRKYGLFLLISSQRPSELSKTVLSQCNNFIVHRIQNPDDLSHIRQITPHISEATLKKLPSIPTQHALIFGSAVNIPTLYKVKNASPLPFSDNNHVSDNWFVDKGHEFDI
jgi:DNA helicase HerA-like ATPase